MVNCEVCGKEFIRNIFHPEQLSCGDSKCSGKLWRLKNKEKMKEYRKSISDEIKKYKKEYYLKNKKEINKKSKLWRENNQEKVRQYNEYWIKNIDECQKKKIFEYQKKYREGNRDEIKKRARIFADRNKEQIKKRAREYRLKNKEKLDKRIKAYRIKTRLVFNKKQVDRRKKDKNFNMKCKLRNRLWNAFNKYEDGKRYSSSKYGINYNEIIEHLKPFPKDISKYHIDHIKPLCTFDLTDNEQVKVAFAPENHQWLTVEQNFKKGGRYGSE